MPIIESRRLDEGGGFGAVKLARGDYSFAVEGGAVSTIALTGSSVLPAGAVILAAYIEVVTAPTSGGAATITVQAENAGDVQAAAAISGAPWSTLGMKLSSARTRAAVPLKLTAPSDISIVVATAALTAGVFRVYVEYIEAP